jgi:hypothetical protein
MRARSVAANVCESQIKSDQKSTLSLHVYPKFGIDNARQTLIKHSICIIAVTLEKRDMGTAQVLVQFDPHFADALSGNNSSSLVSSAA